MSLEEKPQRMPGEFNSQWESRKNNYRINLMEQQIKQLFEITKRLEK